MRLLNYPGCCTAYVIQGFGQSRVAGDATIITGATIVDKQAAKDDLERILNKFNDTNSMYHGKAIITATTNSDQKVANDLLEEFEFQSTGWIKKDTHPKTLLKLWWKIVGEEVDIKK